MSAGGKRIAALAAAWIGTPYRHQASLIGVGADCLGLVRGVWREAMGPEPEAAPAYSPDWAEAGLSETLLAAARRHLVELDPAGAGAGDVLLFRWRAHLPAKHAGILASADRMIHAQEGCAVCEVTLSAWWRRHIAAAFRFPDVRCQMSGVRCQEWGSAGNESVLDAGWRNPKPDT